VIVGRAVRVRVNRCARNNPADKADVRSHRVPEARAVQVDPVEVEVVEVVPDVDEVELVEEPCTVELVPLVVLLAPLVPPRSASGS